jgi:hypothetical protein
MERRWMCVSIYSPLGNHTHKHKCTPVSPQTSQTYIQSTMSIQHTYVHIQHTNLHTHTTPHLTHTPSIIHRHTCMPHRLRKRRESARVCAQILLKQHNQLLCVVQNGRRPKGRKRMEKKTKNKNKKKKN